MPNFTFEASFTDEQITAFALAKGWQEFIGFTGSDERDPNPVPPTEFVVKLVRQELARYLIGPQIAEINRQLDAERLQMVETLQTSVDAAITVEVQ